MSDKAALPKLVYFPINGRAFAIRASLRHGKVPYEDVRVTGAQLQQLRGADGWNEHFPLGSMPVMEMGGRTFFQSVPLAKWAAKKSDLYPADELEQLAVDVVMETANELASKLPQHADQAEKKRLREEFAVKMLPRYAAALEANVKGPFVLGDRLTVADLTLFNVENMFVSGNVDFIPGEMLKQKWPKLAAHRDAVAAHPIAKAELEAKV